jgi:hypothetical protein
MDSRRRVLASLSHQSPDQVPVDFGSTATTGVHVSCVAGLREHYGLEKSPIKVHEPYQMLGVVEDDLKEAMGIDVQGVWRRETLFGFRNEGWKPWRTYDGLEVLVPANFNTTIDEKGDTLIYPKGDTSAPASGRMPKGGYFFDTIVRQRDFKEEELNPEDNLEEFEVLSEKDLGDIESDVLEAVAGGKAVVANFGGTGFGDIALVPAPFLKYPKGIRDITEWYVSLKARPDYVHEIFDRQCDIAVENLQKIQSRIGNKIDVVFICGTDFGTQTSSFCSDQTFRELWFPYYKRVNDWIHKNTTWKTFKHSCGSVERFLNSFIECGFDILNPVQCSAANMSPEHLKESYGSELVFWGGGVDTQKTLPFGSTEEVRREVLDRCEVFARGGGFIFNSIHNLQARTPVENIVAMLDAVTEFNGVG